VQEAEAGVLVGVGDRAHQKGHDERKVRRQRRALQAEALGRSGHRAASVDAAGTKVHHELQREVVEVDLGAAVFGVKGLIVTTRPSHEGGRQK